MSTAQIAQTDAPIMGDAVSISEQPEYSTQISACEGCHHDCGCDGDDVPPCPGDACGCDE
jgi:hypothetical protein